MIDPDTLDTIAPGGMSDPQSNRANGIEKGGYERGDILGDGAGTTLILVANYIASILYQV